MPLQDTDPTPSFGGFGLNRNKISIALRLDQKEGREAFLDLVAVSDVVVENFRPRVMRNFGLAYEELS